MTDESQDHHAPVVSVLMPTYRQEAFLPRAIGSLLAQTLQAFELIVVNDGSGPSTDEIVAGYDDPRLRYVRLEHNRGLGAVLNLATEYARGEFLAYLPSDDVYDPEHLATAVDLLRERPEVYLAYAGVRWCRRVWDVAVRPSEESPTLRNDIPPGAERRALVVQAPTALTKLDVRSGNFLAPVQVVHRRGLERQVRWRERSEVVSDSLEMDFWRGLLAAGAEFAYTGAVTCEWGDHPEQHHKIISGRGTRNADPLRHGYGLSYYRQFYRLPSGQPLNWQPVTEGLPVDERRRYGRLLTPRPARRDGEPVAAARRGEGLPAANPARCRGGLRAPRPARRGAGLRILLVGALGFNPERVLAFEEAGHRLAALWAPRPHFWENTGPLPFGAIEDIAFDDGWAQQVRRFRPDVAYGLLNWPAVPMLHAVRRAVDCPFVLHFKESPISAMQVGTWPMLRELVLDSDGRILASPELREWFEFAVGRPLRDATTMVLDADMPKIDWMTDDWAPALSDSDDEPHTVSTGRVYLEPMAELAQRRIHVHLYGRSYERWASRWISAARDSPYLHLHGDVEPADWVTELSRYDGAWLHTFSSGNDGELHRASWDDLNLPARIGTYASAGLPWIYRRNAGHRVAVDSLARRFGVGLDYEDLDDLARVLKQERHTRAARAAMRRHRNAFAFDTHVDQLTDFFSTVAVRARRKVA